MGHGSFAAAAAAVWWSFQMTSPTLNPWKDPTRWLSALEFALVLDVSSQIHYLICGTCISTRIRVSTFYLGLSCCRRFGQEDTAFIVCRQMVSQHTILISRILSETSAIRNFKWENYILTGQYVALMMPWNNSQQSLLSEAFFVHICLASHNLLITGQSQFI